VDTLAREQSLLVFAQDPPRLDVDGWNGHAVRFFSTRIGLAEQPSAPQSSAAEPFLIEARLVVAPDRGSAGYRGVLARARDTRDLALADQAETKSGSGGLALLARRCAFVWLVERVEVDDDLSWNLAAILASVCLGPILDRTSDVLTGPKSARQRAKRRI